MRPYKHSVSILILASFSVFFTPQQSFAESDWSWSTNLGVYSDYMFRGKNVYDGLSIQPSTTGSVDFGDFGALSANVWVHASAETREPPERFTEIDYTLTYDLSFDVFSLTLGHIWYTFPGDEERIAETEEFFVTASIDVFANPTLTVFADYQEAEYEYYSLVFREPVPLKFLNTDSELYPYVRFGFASNANDGPVLYIDNGLVHVDVGASLDFSLGELYVSPSFHFTFETDEGATNEAWMGVDIGFEL